MASQLLRRQHVALLAGLLALSCLAAVHHFSRPTPVALEKSYGDGKVYADGQVFEEGAVFGDHNRFGRNTRFGAGTRFGDNNKFGDGSTFPAAPRFGPGSQFGQQVTIGAMATIGPNAVLGAGAVVGQGSAFGPEATIGDNAFIAGGQIFEGGDSFGSHITFGPYSRFGPNTMFNGAELFSMGCTFGDHTSFNYRGAGSDTFMGGHSFGRNIDWGGNPSLPTHPKVSEKKSVKHNGPRGIAHAAPSHGEDSLALPPGYTATSIPGVYQYTAPEATKEAMSKPHKDTWDWTWHKPVPGHLAPAGLRSSQHSERRTHVLKSKSTGTKGSTVRPKARGKVVQKAVQQIGDDLQVVTKRLDSWLKKHPSVAAAGPSTTIVNSNFRPSVRKSVGGEKGIEHVAKTVQGGKMDGLSDRRVKVVGSAQDPSTADGSISFFDMF